MLFFALVCSFNANSETIAATASAPAAQDYIYNWQCTKSGVSLASGQVYTDGPAPSASQICGWAGQTFLGSSACGTPPSTIACNAAAQSAGRGCDPADSSLVGGSCVSYTCPSSGGWTLSGQTCTRPDPCTSGESVSFSIFSGYSLGRDKVMGGSANPYTNPTGRCNGHCVFDVASVSSCPAAVGTVDNPTAITCHGTGTLTGATCTNDESTAPLPPTVPFHRPKCNAGEGVLTSSSGTVACVPSGTPSSEPVVRTEKQTQQFPDGSTRTTETTYTKDPLTQVQDTQQQITNTPATGGGAGQAGPVGTTTTAGSSQSSSPTDKEASDFCKANGNLQICQGDMNKEETQIQVRDYIKSLTDPGATPYNNLETSKHSDQSQTELQTELDKFTSAGTGQVMPDSASKTSWENAMSTGWFEPITRTGCQPYSATISGHVWNLDICPTAEKISVISEYVIWFLLVVGVFVMFTGGSVTRSS